MTSSTGGVTVFAVVEGDIWGWRWSCHDCHRVADRLYADATEAALAATDRHRSCLSHSSISRRAS